MFRKLSFASSTTSNVNNREKSLKQTKSKRKSTEEEADDLDDVAVISNPDINQITYGNRSLCVFLFSF